MIVARLGRCTRARWRHYMRLFRPCLITAIILALAACSRKAPDPECEKLVRNIIKCDKTSSQMPEAERSRLRSNCAPVRKCAKIDTTKAGGCTQFMGCLYDYD